MCRRWGRWERPGGNLKDHQAAFHGEGFDYVSGSPHLSNAWLRQRIETQLVAVVTQQLELHGRCRVLDVGGGHGNFAETMVATGASVTITEMSAASAKWLRNRFRYNPEISVLDDDGTLIDEVDDGFDVLAYLSVLHHIPDYVGHVSSALRLLSPGGAFVSFQDPLLYARCSPVTRTLSRASYFAWRATQGDLRRGVATRVRRLRGILDDHPEDMVEYHVVRDGVDEMQLYEALSGHFESVRLDRYWSTQAHTLSALGTFGIANTFGLVALGYRPAGGCPR